MTTTDYLQRELRRVELSMRRAAKKQNTPPEELRGLQEKRANLCEARAAVLEMQARPEAGKPLTLEQLRGMDGRCVNVTVDGIEPLEMLALVEVQKDEDCVLLRNNLGGVSEFYSDEDLIEDGVKVYAYAEDKSTKSGKRVGLFDVKEAEAALKASDVM